MGLLGRILDRFAQNRTENQGARLEAEGKLEEAYAAYVTANRNEDALRILLVRADAEPDPSNRLALLQLAASRADSSEISREASRRAASLRLDLLRTSKIQALPSELINLAQQLERLDMNREAAEVYGLAGDTENQTRALIACGAIYELENAFESERRKRNEKQDRERAWKEMQDLNATGKRRACLQRCEQWLSANPQDESVEAYARTVRSRLIHQTSFSLILEGQRMDISVDHPLTLGRTDASVVLPSPALSRKHIEIRRSGDAIMVRDLGSRNGTWLAGMRVDGPVQVGKGIELNLGQQVPLQLEPWPEGGVRMTLPGRVILASLGPYRIGPFEIAVGDQGVVQLTSIGSPPILNGITADSIVDLARGDRIQSQRTGPVLIEVVAS